jgi:hypothetical protein
MVNVPIKPDVEPVPLQRYRVGGVSSDALEFGVSNRLIRGRKPKLSFNLLPCIHFDRLGRVPFYILNHRSGTPHYAQYD